MSTDKMQLFQEQQIRTARDSKADKLVTKPNQLKRRSKKRVTYKSYMVILLRKDRLQKLPVKKASDLKERLAFLMVSLK